MEAFPRVGAQIDVVCKGRSKEGEEGAENEGGAHRAAVGNHRGPICWERVEEGLQSTLSRSLQVLRSREQEADETAGHARHLFPAGIGESGSAESCPKGKLFDEDMIHFYSYH